MFKETVLKYETRRSRDRTQFQRQKGENSSPSRRLPRAPALPYRAALSQGPPPRHSASSGKVTGWVPRIDSLLSKTEHGKTTSRIHKRATWSGEETSPPLPVCCHLLITKWKQEGEWETLAKSWRTIGIQRQFTTLLSGSPLAFLFLIPISCGQLHKLPKKLM